VPNQYASYDAMGNMTCRNVDTTTAHSCGSTQTGATMTYDTQGRLASWTAPSGTSANEQFLYDNEGNRVLQRTVSTVGSTTTVNDTITFDGYTQTSIINEASPTTTKYYTAAGHTVAMAVGGTWYALVADGLGSTTLALKGDGTVQAVLTPIMMVSTAGIPFILKLLLAPL
jgi:YD repeat-containing protein